MLLSGKAPDNDFFEKQGVEVRIKPALNYMEMQDYAIETLEAHKKDLSEFLYQNTHRDSLIHVHNLNLGKNPVLTLALSEMAAKGYRLFNHCHDFAEDRPANFEFLKTIIQTKLGRNLQGVLYPSYPNYLFGTLNDFDRKRIIQQGIPESRITHLPNPVHFEPTTNYTKAEAKQAICSILQLDNSKKLITYPVRVIRRKNIGELILLSILFEDQAHWLVTQPPKNPVEIVAYQKWKNLCSTLKVPLVFEAGTRVDFEQLLVASDVCISTSVREGFGMVFLEPWLLNTPVMGRNIDYVTEDLKKSGVYFPLLYDTIRVELNNGMQDFGALNAEGQQEIIEKIRDDEYEKKQIRKMNPQLETLLHPIADSIIEQNKKVIRSKYSLKNYAERLHEIYRKLAK
jgi:glycosyltransferase involved in cell wall biosynthesis